jgi:hypothetical protein
MPETPDLNVKARNLAKSSGLRVEGIQNTQDYGFDKFSI